METVSISKPIFSYQSEMYRNKCWNCLNAILPNLRRFLKVFTYYFNVCFSERYQRLATLHWAQFVTVLNWVRVALRRIARILGHHRSAWPRMARRQIRRGTPHQTYIQWAVNMTQPHSMYSIIGELLKIEIFQHVHCQMCAIAIIA